MTPRVTVIVAARNCEAYVAEAIDSIVTQTYTNWELVIADDGSTDQTREIIDRYRDPRIRRIHNDKHLGLVCTWNNLIKHADGELIAWQDADDISYPNRLEKLVTTFELDPTLMLCGSNAVRPLPFNRQGIVTNHPIKHDEIIYAIEKERRIPFLGGTRMIRRELLGLMPAFRPFFEGIGGEDLDFIVRTSEKYRVANVPDVLYVYRYTRNSNSRQFNRTHFLKLYVREIIFYLADQRKENNGLDGLMEGGDGEGLDKFINGLRHRFEQDPSVIFRRACHNKINNCDYVFAFLDALQAIQSDPLKSTNYILFPRIAGSLIKALLAMAQQIDGSQHREPQ